MNILTRSWLCVALMVLPCIMPAKAQNIDSLLQVARNETNDSTRTKRLLNLIIDMRFAGDPRVLETIAETRRSAELAGVEKFRSRVEYETGNYFEYEGNYDSAFYHLNKGLSIGRAAGDKEEIAIGHYYIGSAYRFKGDGYTAYGHFDSSAKIFLSMDSTRQAATCIFSQAVVLDNVGEFQQSLDKFYEALEMHEQIGDNYGIANCYNSIGILTERSGKLEEAMEYYKKGMELFEKEGIRGQAANCMDNLGNILIKLGRMKEGMVYHDLALQERKDIDDKRGVARSLMNISDDHVALGEHQKALEKGLEALDAAIFINDPLTEASVRYRVSHAYRRLGDYAKAAEQGILAIQLADSISARNELLEARLALSYAYKESGRFEDALHMYEEYVELKDTLINEENLNKVSELEAKYQNAKQEEKIKLQEKEKEVLQASLSSRNFQIALVAALLLIALGVIIGVRNRAKAQRALAAKDHEIDQQRIKELEQEQKILFMDAMITGQEEERKRVAKDLHDGLGVLLSTVQMHFNAVQEEIRKLNELDIYGKANELLDEACSEVRKIAHNMMPGSLTKFGLPEAIEELRKNLVASSNIEIELQTFGLKERLPEKVEIMLYRVAQEALNNCIKYAEATSITIDLSKEEDQVHLVIEDNGKGFNVEEVLNEGGHGLNNIHSRVKYLNGSSYLTSEPGKGTLWEIKVPLT